MVAGDFDTGRNLKEYPTEKLEGKKIAIIGYGNIGREMAKLAHAFGMRVAVHARPGTRNGLNSEGFEYAATAEDAARGADVISPHTGLGALNAATGKYVNAGVVRAEVLAAMNDGAVVINYDRGEVVDAAALDAALAAARCAMPASMRTCSRMPRRERFPDPWCPTARWRRATGARWNCCPMRQPTRSTCRGSKGPGKRLTRYSISSSSSR